MRGERKLIPPSDEVMRASYIASIIEMATANELCSLDLERRLEATSLDELILIWVGLPLNINAALSGLFPTMYYAAAPDAHRPVVHYLLEPSDQLDIDMGTKYLTKVPLRS